MDLSKARVATGWLLAVLLAAVYVMVGLGKVSGGSATMFAAWGYPSWFAIVIGAMEVGGGALLFLPRTTRYAVWGLSAIMIGAAFTHVSNGEGLAVMRPIVFMSLLWVLWALRRTTNRRAIEPAFGANP